MEIFVLKATKKRFHSITKNKTTEEGNFNKTNNK